MKYFIQNNDVKLFAVTGMLGCLLCFESNAAAVGDSTSKKLNNRLTLSFSGNLGTSVEKPFDGPYGYRAQIDYALGISPSARFGFGLAYSGVPFQDVKTLYSYWDPDNSLKVDRKEVYNYIELPVFLQVNLTHSSKVIFNFRFGAAAIKKIHAYDDLYLTGGNSLIPSHFSGGTSYPLIGGDHPQPIKAAIFLAPGVSIKLSQKFFLGVHGIVSFYPDAYTFYYPPDYTSVWMYGLQCSLSRAIIRKD